MKRNALILVVLVLILSLIGCQSSETSSSSKKANAELSASDFIEVVKSGDINAVSSYIERGVDVNIQLPDGTSALITAAVNNDFEIIELLLDHGADIELKTTKGKATPLCFAAMMGSEQAAEALIENGADVNAQDQGMGDTPLMYAIKEHQYKLVKLLYKQDVDLQIRNNDGVNAIELAMAVNDPDINRFLGLDGAMSDPEYRTLDDLEGMPAAVFDADTDRLDVLYQDMIGRWSGKNELDEEIAFEFLPDKTFILKSLTSGKTISGYYHLIDETGLTQMYIGTPQRMSLEVRKVLMPDKDTLCLMDRLGYTKRLTRN